MAESPVLVERRPPAALVTLNRPEKYNALNVELLQRLRAVVDELGKDDATRVIILRGSTKYFSTGTDLDDLSTVTSVADTHRHLQAFRDTNTALERCPKPVIAAISGYCLTGGLELALACDIRRGLRTHEGVSAGTVGPGRADDHDPGRDHPDPAAHHRAGAGWTSGLLLKAAHGGTRPPWRLFRHAMR